MIFLSSLLAPAATLVVFYHSRRSVQLSADHWAMTVFSLVFVNKTSDSVYRTHYFVFDFMAKAFLRKENNTSVPWLAAYVAISVLFSVMTYQYIVMVSRRCLVGKLWQRGI